MCFNIDGYTTFSSHDRIEPVVELNLIILINSKPLYYPIWHLYLFQTLLSQMHFFMFNKKCISLSSDIDACGLKRSSGTQWTHIGQCWKNKCCDYFVTLEIFFLLICRGWNFFVKFGKYFVNNQYNVVNYKQKILTQLKIILSWMHNLLVKLSK